MEELSKYFILIIPIVAINLILVAISLVDIAKRDKENITGENKIVWILIIIFVQMFGPLAYLIFGRKA